jgi:hypothetical protein
MPPLVHQVGRNLTHENDWSEELGSLLHRCLSGCRNTIGAKLKKKYAIINEREELYDQVETWSLCSKSGTYVLQSNLSVHKQDERRRERKQICRRSTDSTLPMLTLDFDVGHQPNIADLEVFGPPHPSFTPRLRIPTHP